MGDEKTVVRVAKMNVMDSQRKMKFNRGMFVEAPAEFFDAYGARKFGEPKKPYNAATDEKRVITQFSGNKKDPSEGGNKNPRPEKPITREDVAPTPPEAAEPEVGGGMRRRVPEKKAKAKAKPRKAIVR
jgi:hypothetical protein